MLNKVLSYTTALGLIIGLSGPVFATDAPAAKPASEADQKKVDEVKEALGSLNIDVKSLKGDEVVARVGKKVFTAKDVAEGMEETYMTAMQGMGPEFAQTLTPEILFLITRDRLIDTYLIDQEVETNRKRLEKQSEVQEAIAEATNRVLQESLMKEKAEEYVTKAAIREKYEEYSKQFPKDAEEVHLRMIVLKTEDDAKKVIEKLNQGSDFIKLAREETIEKQLAKQDGDLGYVNEKLIKSSLPGFEVIFEKKDGKPVIATGSYTKTAIKSPMGYHVLKVEDRRPLKKKKLSEIEPKLKSGLQQEAIQKMRDALRVKAGTIERLNPNTGKPMRPLEEELAGIQAKVLAASKDIKAADAKPEAKKPEAKAEEKPADKK